MDCINNGILIYSGLIDNKISFSETIHLYRECWQINRKIVSVKKWGCEFKIMLTPIVGLLLLCLPAEDLRRSATTGESS